MNLVFVHVLLPCLVTTRSTLRPLKILKYNGLVFHWCLYNKQNITCPLMDMNFIFSWSTRYLTRSLRSLVRYWVDHSKIKFISTRGHVISSIYFLKRPPVSFVMSKFQKQNLVKVPFHFVSQQKTRSSAVAFDVPLAVRPIRTNTFEVTDIYSALA